MTDWCSRGPLLKGDYPVSRGVGGQNNILSLNQILIEFVNPKLNAQHEGYKPIWKFSSALLNSSNSSVGKSIDCHAQGPEFNSRQVFFPFS